ncbi:cobyric acid synthase [Shewanella olleyana]|uniref:cobyric acid synthase n=1 Tax=Shewanella olleyana TaxID=135626 RepID=UPI00200EFDBE|nr:cobyric acid synthase [Shewanella olleyana]MCL1066692.1 cobyric acid synthase [Shewanella olleyana]
MVQGTTSDAGKSTLVAGLCRVFARQGNKVAPFKPQNMALNSAVTIDGGEIGRAQALQAVACKLEPHTDFNPVLLKPSSDTGSQIIIHGKALTSLEAQAFFGPESRNYKSVAMNAVLQSFERLTSQYEMVVVEGAGSPAEINLREGDIANMGFAEAVDCPVIIIADIDKGGVFAHLVGTLALLSVSEQNRVKGFVINRFRGDISLLQSGIDWLESYTNKPVIGVLPYLHDLHLDAEDALVDNPQTANHSLSEKLKVLVLVFPRISNHTDFDPLRLNPNVEFNYVSMQTQSGSSDFPIADLIILPGSKNVRADLAFMREQGWDIEVNRHLRYGGKVIGVCGGYQMLGTEINDPNGIEDVAGSSKGLGLIEMTTELTEHKTLQQVQGQLTLNEQQATVNGYEIHCGQSRHLQKQTQGQPLSLSFVFQNNKPTHESFDEGCLTADNQILGTYVHGLFDSPNACQLILTWAGLEHAQTVDINQIREQQLERLADVLEAHLDMEKLTGSLA